MQHDIITGTTANNINYVYIGNDEHEGGVYIVGQNAMRADYAAGSGGQWECEYMLNGSMYFAGGVQGTASVKDENGVIFAGTKQQVEEYMIELLAVF